MSLWTHTEAESATLGKASQAFAVTGISIDTRTIKEGDLFVALQGDNRDGHEFVQAAFKAKAGAALVARPLVGVTGPLLTVGHTQRGLEDLARASRARSHAKILAVTGSAGKPPPRKSCGWLAMRLAAPTHRRRPTTITGACRSAWPPCRATPNMASLKWG